MDSQWRYIGEVVVIDATDRDYGDCELCRARPIRHLLVHRGRCLLVCPGCPEAGARLDPSTWAGYERAMNE